jgi:hypothetical protein
MNFSQSVIGAIAVTCSTLANPAWSQAASDVTTEPSNDPFVQQRNAIDAANRAYKEKVAIAQKEFDRKENAASKVLDAHVDQARAERKKAIAAAKAAGG